MVHTIPDRSPWTWAVAFVFPLLTVLCFSAHVAAIPVLVLAALGAGIVLWRVGFTLACAFLVLSVAPFVVWRWLSAAPILFLPFLPVLLGRNTDGCPFPFKIQTILLLVGFSLGHTIAIVSTGAINANALDGDTQFLLMLVMCFVVFYLMRSGALTPHRFAVAIALAGLPFLLMLLLRYSQRGLIGSLLVGRLGSSVDIIPNLVATLLDLVVPFPVFLFISERRRSAKVFYLALALLYILAILLTYSRGSIFGLAALAVFLAFKYRKRGGLLYLSGACLVFALYFGAQYLLRFQARDPTSVISNLGRLLLYSTAIDMLRSGHYLIGIGMNQYSQMKFSFGFPRWFDPTARMSSHNMYLEMWLSWGLAGIVGWVWLLVSNTVGLLFQGSGKENVHVRWAVAFSVISFALHGFVDCVLGSNYVMLLLFSILGCGAYLAGQESLRRSQANCVE